MWGPTTPTSSSKFHFRAVPPLCPSRECDGVLHAVTLGNTWKARQVWNPAKCAVEAIMAAGAGRVLVALAVGLLLNLLVDGDDPNSILGYGLGGQNRSGIAVFAALAAFLTYIAGILLIYLEECEGGEESKAFPNGKQDQGQRKLAYITNMMNQVQKLVKPMTMDPKIPNPARLSPDKELNSGKGRLLMVTHGRALGSATLTKEAGTKDNKNRSKSSWRGSSNFKSQTCERKEDVFEIEDAKFPVSSLLTDHIAEKYY
ncbi:hypothetical protein Taro_027986 [Colocasia esculenta]|uniref:Uncharacterized protein n=1 Tax=Colocasia esculenta TaxID=4460 RepID=A0A843VVW7_COLES|nr:hypothetical protein [Colocasia esculenta]